MLNFITDRTYADVERWKRLHDKGWEAMTAAEQTEWLNGMKGAYQYTDMNRVEGAVEVLLERLQKLGKTNATLITKTNWTRASRPTAADMSRYFSNVEALKAAMGINLYTPSTPTIKEKFDYNKANDLEKILAAIDAYTNAIDSSLIYSAEIYAGEV